MALTLIRPPNITPLVRALVLSAPPSKSVIIRGLFAAAQRGGGTLERVGEGTLPEDVRKVIEALRLLDVSVEHVGSSIIVSGRPHWEGPGTLELDPGEGAAPARFLLGLAALCKGPIRIGGRGRLLKRPMAPLLEALEELGADIRGGPFLPVTVRGPIRENGRVAIDSRASSQFLSAALLMGAGIEDGLVVEAREGQVSTGYVALTVALLRAFGIPVEEEEQAFRVRPGPEGAPATVTVERDWSGASALLAASAYLDRPVHVPGLTLDSRQPDRRFALLAGGLGLEVVAQDDGVRASGQIRRPAELFVGSCPDAVPALVALGALAPGWVHFRGAPHLRLKESDRIASLIALLQGVGLETREFEDGLGVKGPLEPRPNDAPIRVTSRGDHRMAMAAGLLGLRVPLLIDDTECVDKSFPGFFEQWPGAASD